MSVEHAAAEEDLKGIQRKLTMALEEASELTARIDTLSHDKEARAAALARLAQEQDSLVQQKDDAEEQISKLEAQVPPSSHHTNVLASEHKVTCASFCISARALSISGWVCPSYGRCADTFVPVWFSWTPL